MAIVYRHIRKDKNEPFYIGIGSSEKRAFQKTKRSKFWKNVAELGYEVEILFEDLSWEDACKKEIELIKLYGRKDLNLGSLVNLTDGGDLPPLHFGHKFNLGRKQSTETKNKKNEKLKGRKTSDETKLKQKEAALKNGNRPPGCVSHTFESKLKMSNSHKGKKLSDEHKKNVSNSLKGRVFSDEHRKKLSEAAKNRKHL